MTYKEPKDIMDNAQHAITTQPPYNVHDSPPDRPADYGNKVVMFDWPNKWLKGDEYYHILTHADLYSSACSFKRYPPKTHPSSTYTNPKSIAPRLNNRRWNHLFRRRHVCWFLFWLPSCRSEETIQMVLRSLNVK